MSSPNTLACDEIVKQLKDLTKDLFYLSESDYPLEVVVLDHSADTMTVHAAILAFTGQPAGVSLQEELLPYFFRNLTKDKANDDQETRGNAERFRLLQDFMEQQLQDVKVYRIGRREIKAFAVGKTTDNYYTGFKTIVVET